MQADPRAVGVVIATYARAQQVGRRVSIHVRAHVITGGQQEGIDAKTLGRVTQRVRVENLGLVERDRATGEIGKAKAADLGMTFGNV